MSIKQICKTLLASALLLLSHAQAASEAKQEGKTYQIILLRHGESMMNTQGRTSGWGDTHLSEKGAAAALEVGKLLKKEGISFDAIYTSYLSRAIKTAYLTLEGMDMMWIPIHTDWRLNETNQGAFEGKTRDEQVAIWGEKQVKDWELSFDMRPPLFASDDPSSPTKDLRYSAFSNIPQTESMEDTLKRVRAYWQDVLIPAVRSGKTVMVIGHSNVLRALSKCIDDSLDVKTLKQMSIPNSAPIIYTLDADMKPVSSRVLSVQAK